MAQKPEAQINCPKCGTPVDVNKVLYDKVQAEIGQHKGIAGAAIASVQSLERPLTADPAS